MIYPPGLTAAANQTSSLFSQCKQYAADFEAAGATYNVSAFLLAAFALQESSWEADAVADAGTYGLMQLSQGSRAFAVISLHSAVHGSITLVFTSFQDKCVNIDCLVPKVNINIGAASLKQLMKRNPNNHFAVIGGWNGWYPGIPYKNVIAYRSDYCYCQQNLD